MRCVVADDSLIMRGRLKGYLHHMGHEIVGNVTNAEDAYAICVKTKPDIAFLDVLMPPGNGKETALKLVDQKIVPFVMVVTSNTQEMVLKMLREHGVFTCKKPLTQDKFIRKVEAMINGNSRPSSGNS